MVAEERFIINRPLELFAEVFYEPYLYDLQLFLKDEEAGLVRDHIFKAMPNVDWSEYKGAKQLFLLLEPGEYNL